MRCFFADEVGELYGIWRYWQTWDDALDVNWFVKETVPPFLRYDFDSKYISSREQPLELAKYNRDKGCVALRDDATFTTKERIQRYFCRLLWLTRNCGYGFAFYFFGADCKGTDLEVGVYRQDETGGEVKLVTSIDGRYWKYKNTMRICKGLRLNILIGWKLAEESEGPTRAMIANRILAFKFE